MNHTYYFGFMQELMASGAAKTAEHARAMGFDSVEILESCAEGHPLIALSDAASIREELAARDVRFACYSVGAALYGNPAIEAALMRHADVAAALGSPYLHHTLIPGKPADAAERSRALAAVAGQAARIADYAGGLGLTVIYEDQGAFANGIAPFGEFYEKIKSRCKNVGVCADFGNILYVDEEPEPFIRAFAGEIRHAHMKDYLRSAEPREGWRRTAGGNYLCPCPLGEGVIDIPGCIAALREAGYDGALGYEVESQPLMEGLEKSRRYMKTILNDMEKRS